MKRLLLFGFLLLGPLWVIPLQAQEAAEPGAEESSGNTSPSESAAPPNEDAAVEGEASERWHGRVTVGGAAVRLDDESFKFAEYDRIPDDGFYLVGDAELHYNKSDYHMDLRAEDVGLRNRRLSVESGRYGRYGVFLDYDQIIHRSSNNSRTPLDGAGEGILTLPAGFVTGANVQNLLTLQVSLKEVDLVQERKRMASGFSFVVGQLHFDFSFLREYKDGIRSIGGVVGSNGGNARSIILPEPVNYITDDLRASVSMSGETSQVAVEYRYSQFNNQEETLRWDNPFNVSGGGYQSPLPSNGFQALLQLPPDNQAHDLSLSGGINLPYSTRISGRVAYGQMKQNETLLPFSTSTDASLLPRRTADAEIDTTLLWLNVASRPLRRLSLDAQYKNFSTRNKMPRDLFLYVKNDNINGTQAALNAENAIYSLPYDWAQDQVKVDGSYYLLTGTTFKLGYDMDTINRDYREVNKTREHTYRAGLRSTYFSKVHAGANFSSGRRRGLDDYDQANLFNAIHTQEFIATIADPTLRFQNHPLLRKFDVADRKRSKVSANVTTFPHDTTSIGFFYNLTGDEFDDSVLGLQDRDDRSYTVDLSVNPVEIVSVHAFYTLQEIGFRQVGRNFGAPLAAQFVDPNRNWRIDHDDDTETFGAGLSVSLLENRATISTRYSFSKSNIGTNIVAGAALPPAVDLPDLKTNLHSADITGQYRVTESLSVGVSYLYESYRSDDWATDGIDPGSAVIPTVLTLSGSVPDYRAQVGMVFVTMEF